MGNLKLHAWKTLAAAFVVSLSLSCNGPEPAGDASFTHFFLTAADITGVSEGSEDITKIWSQNEAVSLWNGKQSIVITSLQANKGKTAMFAGESENTGDFTAFYPSSNYSGEGHVTMTIPDKQKAVAGGLSPDCYLLAGKDVDNTITLSNIPGYLAVTIRSTTISSVVLTSSTPLAGEIRLSVADLSVSAQSGKNTVTLEASGSVLTPGTYYVAVVPQTINGFTLTFVENSGKETVIESDSQVAIKAGEVVALADDALVSASLLVACDNANVTYKGDQVKISVNSGDAGWNYTISQGCDWLTEVSRTDTELVLELNRSYLEAADLTADVVVSNSVNAALKETISVVLNSQLLFDARFNEDGTAYDASKYKHEITTIPGDYMFTYYNKTVGRYVTRFNCTTPGGGRTTSYYKFDYENNTAFKSQLANSHTIECLCMLDQALDGSYNYEVKPFSSMQSGGTGFVIGKTNNANKLFFLPNTGSWTFADTKIVMEEGVYYHLVGTFDAASQESKVYVNGQLYGTFKNSSTTYKHASAGSQWFAIGGDPNGATNCGDGWRGDVVTSKIFDGVLSQEDVDALWKSANCGLPYSTVKYDVVFMGDSITQYWISASRGNPTFFTDNNWYNRGITGNTTADMLKRFKYDLELLAPKVMVFCGGTNDIAQNDGVFVSNEEILSNIKSMVEKAEAVGTKVILCSLLPANKYYWTSVIADPSQEIIKVNAMIKAYAQEKNIPYVDYWTPLHDEANGLPAKYTSDGVHPNKACYLFMKDIIKPVVVETLSKIK